MAALRLSVNRLSSNITTAQFPVVPRWIGASRRFSISPRHQSEALESELLHKSLLPTYTFQDSLPRLPLPTLEQTCSRYLQGSRPHLTPTQYETTCRIVDEFRTGVGPELQEDLVNKNRANPHTNYYAKWWSNMYLNTTYSLLLNFNVGFLFEPTPVPEQNTQLVHATNIVVSSLRFMKTLETEALEPYSMPAKPNPAFNHMIKEMKRTTSDGSVKTETVLPIDMSQFKGMFRTSRVPVEGGDVIITDSSSRHICVMRNGHLYSIDVLDTNGHILPGADILAGLQAVVEDPAATDCPAHPAAILTANDRTTWARQYRRLRHAGSNRASLEALNSSIMFIHLDDVSTDDPDEMCRIATFGRGWDRWMDKNLSLFVNTDGQCGCLMEHAWADGSTVLYYMDEMYNDVRKRPAVTPDTQPGNCPTLCSLKLEVPDDMKSEVAEAQRTWNQTVTALESRRLLYTGFGKTYLKQKKISPDSIFQLGYQMAFKRLYGITAPTYESCSTAIFKHGRTETMRPATMATNRVCDMFSQNGSNKAPVEEVRKAMNQCSEVHNKLIMEASMGHGYDRHMFALRHLAAEQDRRVSLFEDESYTYGNTHYLCTSTVNNPWLKAGIFGPTAADGYGIAYMSYKDSVSLGITSYPSRSTANFCDALVECFDNIKDILDGKDFRR